MTAPTRSTCGAEAENLPGECVLEAEHSGAHRDVEGLTWTWDYKRGHPDVYEITWMSGHVERVLAHQVTYPHRGIAVTQDVIALGADTGAPRMQLHAEINGQWRLVLAAREEDIRTMRLVTDGEAMPGGES